MWKLFWKRRDTYQVELAPGGRRPTTCDTGHAKTTSFLLKCSCARRLSSTSALVHPASGYLVPLLGLPEAVLIGIISRPHASNTWGQERSRPSTKNPRLDYRYQTKQSLASDPEIEIGVSVSFGQLIDFLSLPFNQFLSAHFLLYCLCTYESQ
jgi:hypothetical protein